MSCRPKLLCLSAALLLTACATQPVPQAATNEPQAEVNSAHAASCLRQTGTRIRLPQGACSPALGRVYTREDLDRASAMGLGEALFRLGAL